MYWSFPLSPGEVHTESHHSLRISFGIPSRLEMKGSVVMKSHPNEAAGSVITFDCSSGYAINKVTTVFGPVSGALLWHLGNCLVDDKRTSHTVAICGPINTGKGTMMAALSEVFQGVDINVAGSVLPYHFSITPAVVSTTANSRVALASDIDHSGNGQDLNLVKAIAGGDRVV